MNVKRTVVIILISIWYLEFVECIGPLIPIAAAGISTLAGWAYTKRCHIVECCTEDWIPADFGLLNQLLTAKLYGQHLAHKTALYALQGHYKDSSSKKPLVMSFHGPPGSGKNHLTSLIAKSLYKEGEASKYVHFYNSRIDFPSPLLVREYQRYIREQVEKKVGICPRSMFIFDEADKMPEGTLDILVPYIDYHLGVPGVDTSQATFIFLSNAGASDIIKQLSRLWQAGKTRESAQLQDFESILSFGVFNENGGFHKSDVISSSLIDHYIPFLPLEEVHVRQCVMDAFQKYHIHRPTEEMMEEAMSHVTYGSPPYDLWSKAGCKRLLHKVSKIVQSRYHAHPDK